MATSKCEAVHTHDHDDYHFSVLLASCRTCPRLDQYFQFG